MTVFAPSRLRFPMWSRKTLGTQSPPTPEIRAWLQGVHTVVGSLRCSGETTPPPHRVRPCGQRGYRHTRLGDPSAAPGTSPQLLCEPGHGLTIPYDVAGPGERPRRALTGVGLLPGALSSVRAAERAGRCTSGPPHPAHPPAASRGVKGDVKGGPSCDGLPVGGDSEEAAQTDGPDRRAAPQLGDHGRAHLP